VAYKLDWKRIWINNTEDDDYGSTVWEEKWKNENQADQSREYPHAVGCHVDL
jgi:hypothetical protein